MWGLDSLVRPEDTGRIMVGASHGGLLDGEISLATDTLAVFCNDAGVGIEQAGIAQLVRLDERVIIGVAVAAQSACIGSAHSAYEDGTVSYVDEVAQRFGAQPGMSVKAAIAQIIQCATQQKDET